MSQALKKPRISLGKKLVVNPKNTKGFSVDEIVETIEQANLLYSIDTAKSEEEARNQIIKEILREGENYSSDEEILFKTSEELGIPIDYIKKVLKLRYISKESHMVILKNNNSTLSYNACIQDFRQNAFNLINLYKINLIRELEYNVPNYIFKEDYKLLNYIIDLVSSPSVRGGLVKNINITSKEKKNKSPLKKIVNLEFYGYPKINEGNILNLKITIKDPIFLEVCDDKLRELNKKLKNIKTIYPTQSEIRYTHDYIL